jgi:dihydrodipicolinate synthase/N-acetylneuraminate lyase
MTSYKEICGVIPVLHTPFDSMDEIDEEILRREISWVIGHGVDGVATGMVSELLKLSPTERMKLHEIVCDVAKGLGVTVVASSGGETTKQAILYAKHAESIGADAIMVNPPLTTVLEDDELYGYFADILLATEIPLIVQDASGYIGRPFSLELQIKLQHHFESRVYFKPEAIPIAPRLTIFMEATGGKARVLEGSGGGALIDTYMRGVIGTMPGTDTAWAIVALWKALEADEFDRADQISGPLANLIALEHSLDAYLAVEKYLMFKQGVFDNENVRGPFGCKLDTQTRTRIDRLFLSLQSKVFNI